MSGPAASETRTEWRWLVAVVLDLSVGHHSRIMKGVVLLLLMLVGVGVAQAAPFIGSGSGLLGAYCNRGWFTASAPCDGSPDVTRIDATIDFRSGDGNWPAPGIGDDTFSVRWTGQVQAQYTEDYTFHALHDDGVRVWVDGTLVIDNYEDQDDAWTDSNNPISMQRGQGYDIVIEYYENLGDQDMRLAWSSASTPLRTTIPQTQLYPDEAPSGNPLAAYRFDESAWDGTSGQVIDASGNGRDGTAQGGANTALASPAISGDPGTCRYGMFDGSDDYVSVPNLSDTLNSTATLAFWVRTTQSGSSTGYQSPGITGVEEAGGTDDIFWGWIDGSGRIGISVANDFDAEQKSTTAINDGTWHHVALTRDANGGETRVYVDGTLESTGSTPTGTIGNAFESIGRIEDTGGSHEYFRGDIDEVRIYDRVLDESEVQTVYNDTHACPATPAGGSCSATFPSAVQNTANAGSINLEYGAQVIDPDNLLETITLNDNVGYGNTSCGGTDCMATTPLATVPNVPTFQTASGNNDVDTQRGARSFALGQDSETDYDRIEIRNNDTLNDSGNFSTYRIEDLDLYFRSTWNLRGGVDYYVDDLTLGTQTRINVTGSGTARLFVRGEVEFPFGSSVNLDGAPERLIIVGYNDVTVDTGNAQPVNALVYAQGDVILGYRDYVNGAVAAAGSVTLGNSAQVTYDQGAVPGVDDRGFCVGSEPAVDHYAISHSGTGVTCLSTDVTVTAHDSDDNLVDPGTATLDLSTTTGKGDWNIVSGGGTFNDSTPGDGDATYDFPGGESSVTLALNYTDIGSGNSETFNIDVDDGSATDRRNSSDPEDPNLTFALTGLRFANIDDGNATIPTQLSNKRSDAGYNRRSLALQAIRASDSDPSQCNAAFPDGSDRDIEIAGECRDPSECAGEQIRIINNASTNIIPTNDDNGGSGTSFSGSIPLRFTDNGSGASQAEFALRYPDAGLMQLHARYNIPLDDGSPSGDYMTGSSNDFVVRPLGFYLDFDPDGDGTFDDRLVNAACADQTSCAVDADGDVFATAGVDFPLRIEAVVWQSADDGDDNGVPDSNQALADNAATPNFGQEAVAEIVDLDHILVAPIGGSPGTLSGGQDIGDPNDQAFTNGSIKASGVSWDEVGIIDLGASLDSGDYLGSGDDVIGIAPNLGRFIPADFNQTATHGAFEEECNVTFTYIGQAFGYATGMVPELTITARNADRGTTVNYTGSFAKLTRSDIVRGIPTTDDSQDGSDGTLLSVTANVSEGELTDNADGTLTYTFDDTDTFTYDRDIDRDADGQNDARIEPFDAALTTTIDAIEDSDNVAALAANREDVTPTPTTELRFGRLVIGNVYGPETEDLTLSLQAEYFDGNRFTDNSADSCTPLSMTGEADHARLQLDDSGTWVRADEPAALNGGSGGTTNGTGVTGVTGGVGALTLAAPGAENTGFASVRADLSDFSWLRGDWDDDGSYDDFPSARATFGVYRGNDRIIYWQEILN